MRGTWPTRVYTHVPTRCTQADADVAQLRAHARSRWGDALGGVIEATVAPFWTDVYGPMWISFGPIRISRDQIWISSGPM